MKKNIELHQKELGEGGIQIVQINSLASNSSRFPPHRDDHYGIIIQQQGVLELEVDFQTIQLTGRSFCYIQPGQVHYYKKISRCQGWFIFLDNKYINRAYQEILSTFSWRNPSLRLNQDTPILKLVQLIELQLATAQKRLGDGIVYSLVDALIGMMATEVLYTRLSPVLVGSRKQTLVTAFKKMVLNSFREVKQVKQYAAMLYITPLYLNESVKELTGFSASYWIGQEIILEAKRLLRFSTLDINQIAHELGFEDPVYFSRFFKKHAGVTASAFRKEKP